MAEEATPLFQGSCGCDRVCGDCPEETGVCKGLPRTPREPLVELVLIDRRTGEVVGG